MENKSAIAGIFGAEQVRCKLHPLSIDRMAMLGSPIDRENGGAVSNNGAGGRDAAQQSIASPERFQPDLILYRVNSHATLIA